MTRMARWGRSQTKLGLGLPAVNHGKRRVRKFDEVIASEPAALDSAAATAVAVSASAEAASISAASADRPRQ